MPGSTNIWNWAVHPQREAACLRGGTTEIPSAWVPAFQGFSFSISGPPTWVCTWIRHLQPSCSEDCCMGFTKDRTWPVPWGRFHPIFIQCKQIYPATVNRYITDEVTTECLVGTKGLMLKKRIGIISKPHQPGKFHLIANLSAFHGFSLNDWVARL